jgi:hypothetical protein
MPPIIGSTVLNFDGVGEPLDGLSVVYLICAAGAVLRAVTPTIAHRSKGSG